MNIYEHNFKRIMRLFPGLGLSRGVKGLSVCDFDGVRLEIVERHKYTTVIKLMQVLSVPYAIPAAGMTVGMTVRVYHDARVAEVLSYQQQSRFKPKYDYPNPDMHQVREKRCVNEFLGEWLEHCFAQGAFIHTAIAAQ